MSKSAKKQAGAIFPASAWLHPSRLLTLLVLVFSLFATYLLWKHENRNAQLELQADFGFRVRVANSRIEQRMQAYEQVLRGVAGLFTHARSVTRQEFRNYFDRLHLEENYPGFQGLAFLPIVPRDQINRHIVAVHKEGYPGYSIKPEGKREIYTPVVYIEPFTGRNLRAFGHDPYSDPVRRAAMETARDHNHAAISGKVKLVQESEHNIQAGFMMYLPIYNNGAPHDSLADRRANIVGWVSAPFRMEDLMPGLLNAGSSLIDFEIYDGAEMSETGLMYDSDNTQGSRHNARFQAIRPVVIAGHTWTVAARSHAGFEERQGKNRPQFIAYTGMGVSLLLTWLTWLLASSRARALKTAREMNRELIESKARYQQMFDDAAPIAFLVDPDTGRIVDANAAASAFWGYTEDELRNINIAQINIAPDEAIHDAMDKVRNNAVNRLEWRHRLKSGDIRDVEVYSSPLTYQGKTQLYSILHDITERKQAENTLREQKASLDAIFEGALDASLLMNASGVIIGWNPQAEKIFGWTKQEAIGRMLHETILPLRFREAHVKGIVHFLDTGEGALLNSRIEVFAMHRDGHEFPIELSITPLKMEGKQEFSAFIRDITERRSREEELRLAATVFETVDHAVVITDTDNNIITVNPAFTSITGYSREEVVGKNPHVLSSGKHPPEFYEDLWGTLTADGSWHGEVWNRRKLGDVYVEQLSIHLVRNEQGHPTHHVGTFSDISARKAAEEHVQHMAHYDLLTDLPNRALIYDRLRQTLIKAKRSKGRVGLMFLDLDEFKPINDTYGHAVGDLLLKDVAKRLQHCMRESDTVARIGGDEFVVLLPVIEGEQDTIVVADKIQHALSQPFKLAGHKMRISSSIGIAIYPEHGTDDMTLITNADIAMYHAKSSGRNNFKVFRPDMA
ncbi:MAG: CHASE domain-containing protein [Gallionellaceae bacterium]|jgi:diguanylate cyclase (GGDEF)-like protein/PAS domain S-box-containing protein